MAFSIKNEDSGRAITFDVTISETVDQPVTATSHPIADGGNVTDHAQIGNTMIFATVMMTGTPYENNPSGTSSTRLQQTIDYLREAKGKLLTVRTTRRGTFQNCLLLRDPTTDDRVKRNQFDLEFMQIRIAEQGSVIIAPTAPKTGKKGNSDASDVGEQGTKEENAEADSKASIALRIIRALGGDS